jgi:hypothetical protein
MSLANVERSPLPANDVATVRSDATATNQLAIIASVDKTHTINIHASISMIMV